LAEDRGLKFAICRTFEVNDTSPWSTTAIHSVAVDHTPNLLIEKWTLCYRAAAGQSFLFKSLF